MSGLEFVVEMVGAVLVWPVVVVVAIVLFRKQLGDLMNGPIARLIDRTKSVKAGGLEVQAEVSSNLEKAEARAQEVEDALPESGTSLTEPQGNEPPGIAAATSADPSGAVIRAWEELALAVERLRKATAGRGRPPHRIELALSSMVDRGVVPPSFRDGVLSLREVRNKVAHGEHVPTAVEADTFVDTAGGLVRAARVFADKWSSGPDSRDGDPQ